MRAFSGSHNLNIKQPYFTDSLLVFIKCVPIVTQDAFSLLKSNGKQRNKRETTWVEGEGRRREEEENVARPRLIVSHLIYLFA